MCNATERCRLDRVSCRKGWWDSLEASQINVQKKEPYQDAQLKFFRPGRHGNLEVGSTSRCATSAGGWEYIINSEASLLMMGQNAVGERKTGTISDIPTANGTQTDQEATVYIRDLDFSVCQVSGQFTSGTGYVNVVRNDGLIQPADSGRSLIKDGVFFLMSIRTPRPGRRSNWAEGTSSTSWRRVLTGLVTTANRKLHRRTTGRSISGRGGLHEAKRMRNDPSW